MHDDNIKAFDDVAGHVKLEEDHLLTNKPYEEAYMTESKKMRASSSGQKKWKGKVIKQRKGENKGNFSNNKHKHKRHACNESKNMNCFNYGKPSHFAQDCIESFKGIVRPNTLL